MRLLDFVDGFSTPTEPTTVAIPASGVVNTPSGNLGATNQQAVNNELQGDIDTINAKIGANSGIATLDSSGKVPTSQIPALALVDVSVVANITARNALTVQEGDVAVVTDAGSGVSKTYIYDGSSWIELLADGSIAAHLSDTSDAHAASAISVSPSGNFASTNVQAGFLEHQGDIDSLNSSVSSLSTTVSGLSTSSSANASNINSSISGLKISWVSTTSNHIIFDRVTLEDSSGNKVHHGYNIITGTLANGPNGLNRLDTGSRATSTWYYVYIISNGTTVGVLYSTSLTGTQNLSSEPTLPSGYVYRKVIGAVRTDGSGNMIESLQVGDKVQYASLQTAIETTTNDATTQFVDCQASIPPYIAWEVNVFSMLTATYSTNTNASLLILAGPAFGGTATPPIVKAGIYNTASTARIGSTDWFHVFNESAAECRYRVKYSSTSTNRSSYEYDGYVLGYRINCL